MGRILAALALVAFAGCSEEDQDEGQQFNIHVDNQSAEPVWVEAGYYDKVFGMVNPGEAKTFTVDFVAEFEMKVRVFRMSDSFVLFEAVWGWDGDPPSDIPITIAP